MSLHAITPAYNEGSGVPTVRYVDYPTGQTFKLGACLISDTATGLTKEAAATPTTNIVGFALQPADSAPGFNMANQPSTVTYRKQAVSMAAAARDTVFLAALVNGSATPVAPAQTDVYTNYGLSSQGGTWAVDKALTGASAAVKVIGFDSTTNLVKFKVLESALGTP